MSEDTRWMGVAWIGVGIVIGIMAISFASCEIMVNKHTVQAEVEALKLGYVKTQGSGEYKKIEGGNNE